MHYGRGSKPQACCRWRIPSPSTRTLFKTGPCASLLWLTGSTSLSYLPQLPVTYQRRRSCCNPTINAPTDPAESRLLCLAGAAPIVSPVLWEVPRLLETPPFFSAFAKHRPGLFLPACARRSAYPLEVFPDWIVTHIPSRRLTPRSQRQTSRAETLRGLSVSGPSPLHPSWPAAFSPSTLQPSSSLPLSLHTKRSLSAPAIIHHEDGKATSARWRRRFESQTAGAPDTSQPTANFVLQSRQPVGQRPRARAAHQHTPGSHALRRCHYGPSERARPTLYTSQGG